MQETKVRRTHVVGEEAPIENEKTFSTRSRSEGLPLKVIRPFDLPFALCVPTSLKLSRQTH